MEEKISGWFHSKEFRKPQSLEEIIKKESNETLGYLCNVLACHSYVFRRIEKAIQAYKRKIIKQL